jgi:hypothetical protein
MNSISRKFFPVSFISFFLLSFSLVAYAQLNTSSPYSRYGVGLMDESGFAQNYSMGGLTAAMQTDTITPFNINTGNPASLPYVRLTTFEAGFASNTSSMLSQGQSQVINTASLGYIALAFPVKRWWGSAISLQPMSSVGYNVTNSKAIDSIGTVNYTYNGSGGIDKLCWSNGFRLGGLSVGVNSSYLFGRIDDMREAIMPNTIGYYNTSTTNTTLISSFYLDYGIQYGFTIQSFRHKPLRDNIRIVLGATYSNMENINVKTNTLTETSTLNGSNVAQPVDTIVNNTGQKNVIRMPGRYGFGLTVRKGDQLTIGVEYAVEKWSTFQMLGDSGGLKNSSKMIIGAEYVPSHRTDVNLPYFKKIYYRAGLRYSNMPIDINNTQIKETAFTFGVGLPVGMSRHMFLYNVLNASFEVGQRGYPSLLQERFFNVVLSITLNDRWFIKSKFD